MILTGHQPNYLPYTGFFHKIANADCFMIVDDVQFVKRGPFGWINRNRIRIPNDSMWLTVPVLTKGKYHQKIKDVQIDNSTKWATKHWRSIERNYTKAPYFKDYASLIESIYSNEWNLLNELNSHIIKVLLDILEIRKPIYTSSQLDIEGKSTELVINMCRAVKADTYLSGIHGKDYLQPELFEKAGIKLEFQSFQHPTYKQIQKGPFIENLSIIDFIFNAGPQVKEIMCK